MIINPIIPMWLMGIICVVLLLFKKRGVYHFIRQILIVILIFVTNMRIMIPGDDAKAVTTNVDIMFVVDNTISILAEDYNGDGRRIDAVKADCKYIMEQFPGASYSVVSFGNSVERLMPYTIDSNMAYQAIDVLNGQTEYYANGTSLNDVMAQIGGIMKNERDTFKIMFFISDGEIMNSEKLKSFEGLDEFVDAGAVLGYGTKEGGAMRPLKYAGDEDEPEYLYYYNDDYDKVKAISKIDEDNLKQIASDFDVDYVHMTKQSQIDGTIEKLQAEIMEHAAYGEENSKNGYTETYYFFAIPLLLLMIFDYIYYKRKV